MLAITGIMAIIIMLCYELGLLKISLTKKLATYLVLHIRFRVCSTATG